MNKSEVIAYIVNTPDFRGAVVRICPYKEFCGDVFNDILLKVYDIEETKLIDLYNRKSLLYYFIRMVQYEKMWDKYLPSAPVVDAILQEEEQICIYDIAVADIVKQSFEDKTDWYTTKIAENYLKSGSLRKLAKEIDVPYRSLGKAVNQFRDKIVQKHRDFEKFMAKNVLNDLSEQTKEKLYIASLMAGKTPEKLIEDLINGLDKRESKIDSGKVRANEVQQKTA